MTDATAERPTTRSRREPLLGSLTKVIGQRRAVQQLQTAIDAYHHERSISSEPNKLVFGPVLLCGPPGLGKTMIAHLIAQELQGQLREQLGANVLSAAHLRAELVSATEGSILLWDELQELHPLAQGGILLRALEDSVVFLDAQSHQQEQRAISLANFAFVGATTDPDRLVPALRERFKIIVHLTHYEPKEIAAILGQRCRQLHWNVERDVQERIGRLARGIPRIAIRLMESARRAGMSMGTGDILMQHLDAALSMDGIESVYGLDIREQQILNILAEADHPIRLNVIAMRTGLSKKCIAETVEPYPIRLGLLIKTDKGRSLTSKGIDFVRSQTDQDFTQPQS